MQDITEQHELAHEISDAISKPVGFGEEFDDVGDTFQTLRFFYIIEVYLWYSLNACVITHFKTDGCVSSSVLCINSFNTQ